MSLINNDITKFDELSKINVNFVLTVLSMNTMKYQVDTEKDGFKSVRQIPDN